MRYIICGVTFLYGGLSMFAAVFQMKTAAQKDTSLSKFYYQNSLMMLSGGLLLIAAVFFKNSDWIIAVIGGALIGIAAFLNGKRSGNFHISHHIIRFAITALLVLGFLL